MRRGSVHNKGTGAAPDSPSPPTSNKNKRAAVLSASEREQRRAHVLGCVALTLAVALVLQSLALLAHMLPWLAPLDAPSADTAPLVPHTLPLDPAPLPARAFPFALVTDLVRRLPTRATTVLTAALGREES